MARSGQTMVDMANGPVQRIQPFVETALLVAERLNCRSAYLCQSASRLGHSYWRALRWLRFCHGIALRSAGEPSLESAWRTAFSDPARG